MQFTPLHTHPLARKPSPRQTGDLLRAERDSGSPDGAMITQFINEGKIVPVEVTVSLIKKAMEASGRSKFLVDGFPRNFNNLEGWNTVMGDSATVEGVLFYECPEEVRDCVVALPLASMPYQF